MEKHSGCFAFFVCSCNISLLAFPQPYCHNSTAFTLCVVVTLNGCTNIQFTVDSSCHSPLKVVAQSHAMISEFLLGVNSQAPNILEGYSHEILCGDNVCVPLHKDRTPLGAMLIESHQANLLAL